MKAETRNFHWIFKVTTYLRFFSFKKSFGVIAISYIFSTAIVGVAFSQEAVEIRLTISGGIEESIKLHMLPFYGYGGNWKVLVKEVIPSGDSIEFHGKAVCIVAQDTIRFKRDSAAIKFTFQWESQITQEFMDMMTLEVRYSWDAEKYFVSLEHEPKFQQWTSSSCTPEFSVPRRELYFVAGLNSKNLIVFNQWKLEDNKMTVIIKQKTGPELGKFRTRKMILDRIE